MKTSNNCSYWGVSRILCSVLFIISSAIFLVTSVISCSTVEKSLVLGTTIGGATGAALGSQQGNSQNGAAIGALIGAGLGYLSFKEKQKKEEAARFSSEKLELDELDAPYLKSPKIRKFWQNDKIEGRKFIKGHWIYEIEEQPVWMQQ